MPRFPRALRVAALMAACLAIARPTLAERPLPGKPSAAPVPRLVALVRGPLARAGGGPARAAALRDALAPAAATLARHGLEVEPGPASRRAGLALVRLAARGPGLDAAAAAADLSATGAFAAVAPEFRVQLFDTRPNDPDLALQWFVDHGDSADVELPGAWDVARGDTGVVIAILDTGVDLGHPDLAAQIWTNRGEIAGNGLDDDGNGFADDVHGWDFGDGDADANPAPTFDALGMDVGFHGTFCAGIAAAATDNAEGIAGAGWACRLLPLKVSNAAGEITSDALAAAMLYAVDAGASVMSLSLGAAAAPGVPEFFQPLVDAADSAGVLVVAAAGNDGGDQPTYPAANDGVLAVGATDPAGARASFSNFGAWVDLAAPGALMWSALCRNYELDVLSQILYLYLFGWDGVRPYMFGDGTSFACPLVAGVAGLVRARFPTLSPAAVRARLVATGDPVAYDQPIGPKLNAWRAVHAPPLAVAAAAADDARWTAIAPNPARGAVALAFALPRPTAARVTVLDAAGRRVRTLADGPHAAGAHALRWDGRDAAGREVAPGVYLVRLEAGAARDTRRVVRVGR
uniref:T9SS type A sorting domain-containing protein n=1 Tax=Eiseniibacteriota bacterium TaxID=2212470 RepID=A0A832I3G7_UNCEI